MDNERAMNNSSITPSRGESFASPVSHPVVLVPDRSTCFAVITCEFSDCFAQRQQLYISRVIDNIRGLHPWHWSVNSATAFSRRVQVV